MNPVIDKIVWENNARVKNSNLINPSKIINKSSTADFPADKITIRLYNTSKENLVGTAYFYGKQKTYNSAGGYSYQHPDGKLMVTFHKKSEGFNFNGGVTKDYSLQDITDALNYCKDILNKI